MELQYSTRDLARAAVIAAAYAALAWISNFFGLAFPAIQFRLSEALCVLPCRDRKAAIPGLAVGCLITNLLSPYGLLDLSFIGWGIVGSLCLGVGTLWVMTYMAATEAQYYEYLTSGRTSPEF